MELVRMQQECSMKASILHTWLKVSTTECTVSASIALQTNRHLWIMQNAFILCNNKSDSERPSQKAGGGEEIEKDRQYYKPQNGFDK